MSAPEVTAELQRTAALVDMRRYGDAVIGAQRILATDPNNVRAGCLLAQAQLGAGNHGEALRAAQAAISGAPGAEWPHRLASLACTRLGNHERALTEAREAVRLAPDEWRGHIRLAEGLLAAGATGEARVHSDRALELAPGNADVHYTAGRVAHADGRQGEAREAYARTLAIQPDHALAHNELARLRLKDSHLFKSSALADAATGFATALRSDPGAAVSRRNLDIVVIVFLRRTAYFVSLAALIGAETGSNRVSSPWTVLPVALLAIPALFATIFIVRLRQPLRGYLRDAVLHRPQLRTAVLLELTAAVCLVGLAIASRNTRPIFGIAAFVVAALARIQLRNHARKTARAQS